MCDFACESCELLENWPIHRRLDNRKNTYDSFPLVVLGFMFDIGEEESHFLKQFYLGPVLSEWVIEQTGNGYGY